MYRHVSDFTAAWAHESAATTKLLDALTDASLATRVDPAGRTLGKIAWHLVETLGEMSPAAIAAAYREGAKLVGEAVESQWTDASLLETTNMYGQEWARGFTLQCLV